MSYKEEDCLMYYCYNASTKKHDNNLLDISLTPEKVFVTPNLVLMRLLDKLGIKLDGLMENKQ